MALEFVAVKHKDGRTAVVTDKALDLVWKDKGWSKASKEEASEIATATATPVTNSGGGDKSK